MDATVIGTVVAVATAAALFGGFVSHLMMKSELYDYDKEVRKRMHDMRADLNEVISRNALDIERIKGRMNGGSKP